MANALPLPDPERAGLLDRWNRAVDRWATDDSPEAAREFRDASAALRRHQEARAIRSSR